MSVLLIILLFAAACLFLPALVLLVEVLAAATRRPGHSASRAAADATGRSVAVLVPAHDEAQGIETTIRSIKTQLRGGGLLLVVADNCTDDTAQIARAEGAMVVERFDTNLRGKGFALDAGLRALEKLGLPPAVVVVVDADCRLEIGALDQLVGQAVVTGRPVQAAYLMLPPSEPSMRERLSAFAWVVRNLVRPSGAARLGWPCQLMGTGMAFPWSVIAAAPLASGHLVEDLQLGLALARSGTPPLFCPEARVFSTFPTSEDAAVVQRTRWEHGHLSLILGEAPRLLTAGFLRGRPDLIGMALDLAVPPLALLVSLTTCLAVIATAFGVVTGFAAPAVVAWAGLAMVATAVAIAARTEGRGLVSAADVLRVPGYVVSKLPMYGRWLRHRQAEWIRTRR